MKYQVRHKEGTLYFEDLLQVEQAWRIGLIAADDEIREESGTQWCQVRHWSLLGSKQRTTKRVWMDGWRIWIVIAITANIVALVLLSDRRIPQTVAGAILALGTAVFMLKMTMHAQHKRRKSHARRVER